MQEESSKEAAAVQPVSERRVSPLRERMLALAKEASQGFTGVNFCTPDPPTAPAPPRKAAVGAGAVGRGNAGRSMTRVKRRWLVI